MVLNIILIILAIFIISIVAAGAVSKIMLNNAIKDAKPELMSVVRLRNNLCKGAARSILIDVREGWEYERGHIYAANNIPLKELPNKFDEFEKEINYILVCDNAKRSTLASMIMQEEGFKVSVLEGGLKAWKAEGLKLEAGKMIIDEKDIKAQA